MFDVWLTESLSGRRYHLARAAERGAYAANTDDRPARFICGARVGPWSEPASLHSSYITPEWAGRSMCPRCTAKRTSD